MDVELQTTGNGGLHVFTVNGEIDRMKNNLDGSFDNNTFERKNNAKPPRWTRTIHPADDTKMSNGNAPTVHCYPADSSVFEVRPVANGHVPCEKDGCETESARADSDVKRTSCMRLKGRTIFIGALELFVLTYQMMTSIIIYTNQSKIIYPWLLQPYFAPAWLKHPDTVFAMSIVCVALAMFAVICMLQALDANAPVLMVPHIIGQVFYILLFIVLSIVCLISLSSQAHFALRTLSVTAATVSNGVAGIGSIAYGMERHQLGLEAHAKLNPKTQHVVTSTAIAPDLTSRHAPDLDEYLYDNNHDNGGTFDTSELEKLWASSDIDYYETDTNKTTPSSQDTTMGTIAPDYLANEADVDKLWQDSGIDVLGIHDITSTTPPEVPPDHNTKGNNADVVPDTINGSSRNGSLDYPVLAEDQEYDPYSDTVLLTGDYPVFGLTTDASPLVSHYEGSDDEYDPYSEKALVAGGADYPEFGLTTASTNAGNEPDISSSTNTDNSLMLDDAEYGYEDYYPANPVTGMEYPVFGETTSATFENDGNEAEDTAKGASSEEKVDSMLVENQKQVPNSFKHWEPYAMSLSLLAALLVFTILGGMEVVFLLIVLKCYQLLKAEHKKGHQTASSSIQPELGANNEPE